MNSDFTELRFCRHNMERFFLRRGILSSLVKCLHQFRGRVLDVGCGCMPYRQLVEGSPSVSEYIGLDIGGCLTYQKGVVPDILWDGVSLPFLDCQFDTVMATEVLEHCPYPGAVVSEVARVLKPGGFFFATVPFLYRLHEIPNDYWRYTPNGLAQILRENGFAECRVSTYGGWNSSLGHVIGLWISNAAMGRAKRAILSRILYLLVRLFLYRDDTDTDPDAMLFPGLYALAKRDG